LKRFFNLKNDFLVAAGIATKFTTNVDQIEEKFKASTVGLVTLDEVKERQNEFFSLNNKE
jgi:hypothetical protein